MGDELKPWEIAAQQQAKPTSDKKPWEVAADNSQKKSDVQNTTAPILPLDNAAINSTDVAGQQLSGSNANGVLTGLENTTVKPAGYEDLPIDQSTFNKQLDNIRASRTKLNDLTTSQQNIAKDVSHIHNEQTQQLSDLINQYNAAPDKTKPVIKQQIDALKAQPFTGSKVTIPSITSMVDPMAKLGLGGGDQSTQDIEISPKTYTGSDANIPKVKTVGDAYNLLPDKNKTYTDNQAQIAQTKAEFDAARNERLRQIGLDPKNGFFNGVQTAAQMNTRANLVSHFVQNGNDAQGIKEANEYLDDMSFMQQKAQEDKVNNDSPLDIGQEYGAPKLNGMGVYNFYNSMIRPIAGALGLEAAGSLVGAPEAGNAYITYDAYNQAYTNTFLNTYQKLKEENPNDDAGNYTKAKVMAQADAKGSALVMAGGLGIMKMVEEVSQLRNFARNFAGETFAKGLTDYGVKNTAETGLEQLFSSPLAADIVPRTLGQIALHATGESAAFTGLNIAKNAHLQSVAKGLGIEEPKLLEGAGGMAAFPYIMNGMMYAVGKAGDFVMGQKNPYEKWSNETKQNAVISTALTSTPEMVDQMLDKGVASGIITDNHKAILKGQIDDVRTAVGMLPKDASPDEIKAAIPLQIQINKNQALLDGEGAGNVAVDRAETENEKLTTKLHEILGSPLSVDENNTWHDLNKELKENGKLEKPDRLEFDSLSKRRDAAYNKQRAANLKRINLEQEQLPLVGSEDDRISLQDGTKYVTKEGDNYVPHVKGKDKPIADGTTTVDSTAPVGEKVSGDTDKTGVVKQADSAGKAPDTQVGNVTLSEHGLDKLTAENKENGVNDDSNKLTETGKQEARNKAAEIAADIKSGKRPDINTVFHGTVTRTVETAGIIAKELTNLLGHEVTTTEKPELDTRNIGSSEGKTDGSFDEHEWANKPDEAPKGGESWNSFADRAKLAWDFLKSHPDNDHAIASSKMERMLSSLNESNGDVAKAKEIYFDKLKAENDKQAADSQKGTGQVQSDGTTGKKEGDGTGGGLPNGEEKEVGGNDNGKTAGISNRVMADIAKRLGITAPESGEGIDPKDVLPLGKALLAAGADPQKLMDDFNNGAGVTPEGVAIIRAKAAELTKVADDAVTKSGKDSQQAKDAIAALKKFQDDTKPYATKASNVFKSYQGATDVDTGSYIGLKTAFEDKANRPATPQELAKIKALSDEVAAMTKKYDDAIQELDNHIQNAAIDQQANDAKIAELEKKLVAGKKYTVGAKKVADKIREFKSKPFTFTDKNGNVIEFKQNSIVPYNEILEGIAKAVEAGGKLADKVKEILDSYKDADWYKNLDKDDRDKLATQLADHLNPKENDNDIFTRFDGKTDSKFDAKEVKAIWDYAKENYLDKGRTPQEMIRGVATDLNLTKEQVNTAISLPKSQRTITNDMYLQQKNRNKAVQQAKDFVEKGAQDKIDKALAVAAKLPDFVRGIFTAGHGTVAPGTHAGLDAFNPLLFKKYWSFVFNTWKSAFGGITKEGERIFEQRRDDFMHHPLYAQALRDGLAIDAAKIETDYAPAMHIFGKLSGIGDRGFFELKPYRLAKYESELNNLSEIQRNDDATRKMVSAIINNSTGTNAIFDNLNPKAKTALNTTLFAPKLMASQFARFTSEPFNYGVKSLLKMANGTATPTDKAAAKIFYKNTGAMLATYALGLAANQGILMALGSKQNINVTDSNKPDFLRFKGFDKTLDMTGGMLSTFKFLEHIVQAPFVNATGKNPDRAEKLSKNIGKFERGKSAPGAGVLWDFYTHKDFSGNVLPPFEDRISGREQSYGAHQMSWSEYAGTHFTPIPVQEAVRSIAESMKDNGVPQSKANIILSGILTGGIAGLTGNKVGNEPKEE